MIAIFVSAWHFWCCAIMDAYQTEYELTSV